MILYIINKTRFLNFLNKNHSIFMKRPFKKINPFQITSMNYENAGIDYKEDEKCNSTKELYNNVGRERIIRQYLKNFYENNESHFAGFVNGIARGKIQYINDFPLFLKSTKNIPIEIILSKNEEEIIEEEEKNCEQVKKVTNNMFLFNLVRYAALTDEDNQKISRKALISLKKILKLRNAEIIDLISNINFEIDNKITNFPSEIPIMITKLKEDDQKRALLRCVAAFPNIIQNDLSFYINFFTDQLKASDENHKKLKKTAAGSASQIICNQPESAFSKQIMSELPFDKKDPSLSKYCFKALMAQCAIGNYSCFDLPQIIELVRNTNNRTSYDAVQLLRTAAFYSIDICEQLIHCNETFEYLIRNMEHLEYICLLIINIASKGSMFANGLVSLIDILIEVYFDNDLKNKIFIIRAICTIILNGEIKITEGDNPLYEIFLNGIYLDDEVISIIIDTLVHINYAGEDFHQILEELTESDDRVIAYQASKILDQMDQSFV